VGPRTDLATAKRQISVETDRGLSHCPEFRNPTFRPYFHALIPSTRMMLMTLYELIFMGHARPKRSKPKQHICLQRRHLGISTAQFVLPGPASVSSTHQTRGGSKSLQPDYKIQPISRFVPKDEERRLFLSVRSSSFCPRLGSCHAVNLRETFC
jgi:hypothetical protein